MVKKGLLFVLLTLISYPVYSQCGAFAFESGKWSISAEASTGTVLLRDFGKGWEYNYGLGLEWAPFKKLLYFNLNGRHVHQFTEDTSPDPDIFVDRPDRIKIYSTFLRVQLGMKLRLDWWFKQIDYEGIHPFIAMSYMHDQELDEETELFYTNNSIISDNIYLEKQFGGEQYELGFSWVFNDNLKWDLSGYVYDQSEYKSIIKNGFSYVPDSKFGVGLNTGLYITF